MTHTSKWWGEFSLSLEQWGRWRIGPLSLWARPISDEWRFAWRTQGEALAPVTEIEIPAAEAPDTDACSTARFALQTPGNSLQLGPRLADLPVVVRPETPVWIPPGQRTVLFVGTLVWVAVTAGGARPTELMEMPILRPRPKSVPRRFLGEGRSISDHRAPAKPSPGTTGLRNRTLSMPIK